MSAVVIDFASVVALRADRRRQLPARRPPFELERDFSFWHGASGASYVHTVFKLLDCPELPNANVILARRDGSGRAQALHVGRVEESAPSLNLAEIRRSAALIGADEVHVHLLGRSETERHAIERDLTGVRTLDAAGMAAGQ